MLRRQELQTTALAALLGVECFSPEVARAQFIFSNLLEVRIGKDPADTLAPDSRLTRFEQFNLDYAHALHPGSNLRLGLRFEHYVPSDDPTLEYSIFTQRYAEWTSEWLDVRAGNFQALFGRGLVLRAFELPGVVREEFGTPQFGDSRDLDGVKASFRGPNFELVAVGGKPRLADARPDRDRNGTVTGAIATVQALEGLRLGAEYVRHDLQAAFQPSELGGGFVQVTPDAWLARADLESIALDTYIEWARATGLPAAGTSPNVDPYRGRAFYVAQTAVGPALLPRLLWGLAWEYKDYQNFEFDFNEPPQLVREHQFALLNRNTHVLEAVQEEGYQLETTLAYERWADLTLNWSRAENARNRRFREFYAQLNGHVGDVSGSLFAGDSQDGTANLFERKTYGAYALVALTSIHSLELEAEQMTAERRSSTMTVPFKDNHVSLTWSWAERLSLGVVRQTSDDPEDAPDLSRRAFDALTARVRVGPHHELTAFWGRRRQGIQCIAGTCYLVRGFDGVRMELNSRF